MFGKLDPARSLHLPVVKVRWSRVWLISCAAWSWSCADDAPPKPEVDAPGVDVRYRTEYVDIAPLSDTPLCAGTLAMIDDHVEYVMEMLALDFTGRIPMYIFDFDDTTINKWCRKAPSRGCTDRGTIFTEVDPIPHELVHALTTDVGRSWWGEGAAYALAYHPLYSNPEAGINGSSGHLVRWLIEEYGGETFMELYERTPYGADQLTVEAAVREVLGQEFDDLWSKYAATAAHVYPDHWNCYVAPDTVKSPWDQDTWSHEVTLDCDQPDTFSTSTSFEHRTTARLPITIPRDGGYYFFADHPDVEMQVQPCLAEPAIEPIPYSETWPLAVFGDVSPTFLRAGSHVLLVHLPPGPPVAVSLVGYFDDGEGPGR